jgi:hypothetical protein
VALGRIERHGLSIGVPVRDGSAVVTVTLMLTLSGQIEPG